MKMETICHSRTLIEDTRNKINKHLNVLYYCTENNISIIRKKLDVGDYMLEGIDNISVDTKCSILEIASDLSTKNNEIKRFRRECIKAYCSHIKLYILVECPPIYRTIDDIKYWNNPNFAKSKYCISGQRLYRLMRNFEIAFLVKFIFTTKNNTGQTIIELLESKYKEG